MSLSGGIFMHGFWFGTKELNASTVTDSHSGSCSGVFMSKPYTGNRPDKLAHHGSCVTRMHNQLK